jgi:hypothetical protein
VARFRLGKWTCVTVGRACDAAIARDQRWVFELTERLALNWTVHPEPSDYSNSCLYVRWLGAGAAAWNSFDAYPIAEFDPEVRAR